MKNKRGQIRPIIIAGILILAIVFALLFARKEIVKEETGVNVEEAKEIPTELRPVRVYMEECVGRIALDSVSILGIQGGYIFMPSDYLETNYSTLGYGYFEGKNVFNSISGMRAELDSALSSALSECADSSKFPGFNFTLGEIDVSTEIGDSLVIANIDFNLIAAKENFKAEMAPFRVSVPIRLGHIHSIASGIIAKLISDPDWIDMTYLSSFDVKIDIIPYDDDEMVYSISDSSFLVDGSPYVFLFAAKYIINDAPQLFLEDTLYFNDGQPAAFRVPAIDPEGDLLSFSDDTALFDISSDGVIIFTPEVPGEYDVVITVEDNHLNRVSKEVKIVVE